jgi:hypothetical protein
MKGNGILTAKRIGRGSGEQLPPFSIPGVIELRNPRSGRPQVTLRVAQMVALAMGNEGLSGEFGGTRSL